MIYDTEDEIKPFYFARIEPNGQWNLRLDNSMLHCFTQCPRKFYYRYVLLQNLKGMPGALSIGKWWSMVMDMFYTNMKTGSYPSRADFIEMAAIAWKELGMTEFEKQNPKAYAKFGGELGAAAMASEYWERIGHIDFTSIKIVESEAGFALQLYEDNELALTYCGKPDLVVFDKQSQFLAAMDHKTVDRIDSQIQRKYKPHGQTAGYIWATAYLAKGLGYDVPVDRCIMNIAARSMPSDNPKDGVKKPRFTRVYPTYSPEEIEEWKWSTVGKAKHLLKCLKMYAQTCWGDGTFDDMESEFAMYDNSCHLYGGCDYRRVDSVAPTNRQMVFKSDFNVVEPWIPVPEEEEEV